MQTKNSTPICNHCGSPLSPGKTTQKYCSKRCQGDAVFAGWKHRFLERTEPDARGCWIWKGCIDKGTGYGRVGIRRKVEWTHRASWQLHYGEIPKGMYVLHSCDVRLCCNPRHLFLGSQLDNMRDCSAKQRFPLGPRKILDNFPRGAAKANSIHTDAEVSAIKVDISSGMKQIDVIKKYGITQSFATKLSTGRTWRHIPWPTGSDSSCSQNRSTSR